MIKWLILNWFSFNFFLTKDYFLYQCLLPNLYLLSLIFTLHIAAFNLEDHPILPNEGLKLSNSISCNGIEQRVETRSETLSLGPAYEGAEWVNRNKLRDRQGYYKPRVRASWENRWFRGKKFKGEADYGRERGIFQVRVYPTSEAHFFFQTCPSQQGPSGTALYSVHTLSFSLSLGFLYSVPVFYHSLRLMLIPFYPPKSHILNSFRYPHNANYRKLLLSLHGILNRHSIALTANTTSPVSNTIRFQIQQYFKKYFHWYHHCIITGPC